MGVSAPTGLPDIGVPRGLMQRHPTVRTAQCPFWQINHFEKLEISGVIGKVTLEYAETDQDFWQTLGAADLSGARRDAVGVGNQPRVYAL